MQTLDLKRDLNYLYSPPAKKIEVVQVPRLQFAVISGAIEEGSEPASSPGFSEATEALYGISYTLKFMMKYNKTKVIIYPVMPLEGLWWAANGVFEITVKDNWLYTLLILQPDFITQAMFDDALTEVRRKRGDSRALYKLSLESFEEGLCMQVMHIGPYANEPAMFEQMKVFASENGFRDLVGTKGKHHEIYVGDPRKADLAKLKTILRHPIEKV